MAHLRDLVVGGHLHDGGDLALGDVDFQRIGENAVHGHVGDPGVAVDAVGHRGGVHVQKRRALGHGSENGHLVVGEVVGTVHLHRRDGEGPAEIEGRVGDAQHTGEHERHDCGLEGSRALRSRDGPGRRRAPVAARCGQIPQAHRRGHRAGRGTGARGAAAGSTADRRGACRAEARARGRARRWGLAGGGRAHRRRRRAPRWRDAAARAPARGGPPGHRNIAIAGSSSHGDRPRCVPRPQRLPGPRRR